MTRAALVWRDGQTSALHASPLADAGENLVGRAAGATVHLQSNLVSRRQALISNTGPAYRIEQVGVCNPTYVDGAELIEPTLLRDRAVIEIARHRLTFHDLVEAGRTVSYSRCSYCGRTVRLCALLCWYCGTSLDDATSAVPRYVPAAGRLVGESGEVFDLCAGDTLDVSVEGDVARSTGLAAQPLALTVGTDGMLLMARPLASPPSVTLDRAPLPGCRRLATGDIIELRGDRFAVIVR